MIAYNKIWLDNLLLLQQSQQALKEGLITNEEWRAILDAYSPGFYTPHLFIRIGLFLLTLTIGLATALLMVLIFIDDVGGQLPVIAAILAILSYASAEIIIVTKHHFRSGVTEALTWIFAGSLSGAIIDELHLGDLGIYLTLYLVSTWLSFRFADLLCSMISFLSFLCMLFFALKDLGGGITSLWPLLLMISSCFTYVVLKRLDQKDTLRYYQDCMEVVEIVSLLALYAAGNYYVIDHINNGLLYLSISQESTVGSGFLFWFTTIGIPPVYILWGILKKDVILYRVGLVLLVAMVLTIRFYYDIMPVEQLMIFAGMGIVAVAWWLMKLLTPGKSGFTSSQQKARTVIADQVESMVIAETLSTPAAREQTKFGGGGFGGAGAGDSF